MTANRQPAPPWVCSWQERRDRSRKTIDTLAEINLVGLGLADIRFQFGTGVSISNGSGREKKYTYRNGVMTDIGDIKESIWYQLAEHFARFYGEEWLVDALEEWLKAHNYAKETGTQLHQHALQEYSMRLFDDPLWVAYLPFNRKYRPEALESAHIVTIIPDCCNKPGDTTREQILHAYQKRVDCPHCGKWSEFAIVGETPFSSP